MGMRERRWRRGRRGEEGRGKGGGEEGEEGEEGVEGERGRGGGRRGYRNLGTFIFCNTAAWLMSFIPKGEPHFILQRELLHFLLRVADTNKSTWSEYLTFALCFPLFQFLPLVLPAGADQVDGRGRAEEPARK